MRMEYKESSDEESNEESASLLPGRISAAAIDDSSIEDFKTVCTRVVYAVAGLTTFLLALCTTMYVICFQPRAPLLELKEIEFRRFTIQPMEDKTGLPTQGIQAEAFVRLAFYNPSVLYDTNVNGISGSLSAWRKIAQGEGEEFVVPRKSGRVIQLELDSSSNGEALLPLYGAAPLF